MIDYSHSKIITAILFILSIIQFISLYLVQSLLWVPLGLSIILSLIYLITDTPTNKSFIYLNGLPSYFTKIIFSSSLIIVLLSSITSLMNIILFFFKEGSTDLLILIIISIILLFGSTIGLINKLLSK